LDPELGADTEDAADGLGEAVNSGVEPGTDAEDGTEFPRDMSVGAGGIEAELLMGTILGAGL
jgi:hypothetical protein